MYYFCKKKQIRESKKKSETFFELKLRILISTLATYLLVTFPAWNSFSTCVEIIKSQASRFYSKLMATFQLKSKLIHLLIWAASMIYQPGNLTFIANKKKKKRSWDEFELCFNEL